MKRSIAVALTFVAISIVYTWPLVREGRTRVLERVVERTAVLPG
jgi:hypothetical protein